MRYDFDQVVERRHLGSFKWDYAKKATGDFAGEVLAVSTADMDFTPAPEIVAAMREIADLPVYGYTGATKTYYEAVVSWMTRRHSWKIEKEWIVCAPGIVSSLYQSLNAFTSPGDGVVIQPPVYRPFFRSVIDTNRKLVLNPLVEEDGKYSIDFDDLERKTAEPGTTALILCSPHNPVGRVWTRDELARLATICVENDITVISDEIHFDLVHAPHKHTILADLPEAKGLKCVTCTSPSKTFNICGLQASNIVISDPEMREKFAQTYHLAGFHSLNSFAYFACIAAYEKAGTWMEAMLEYIASNDSFVRDFVQKNIPELAISPLEGTFLQWIDFSGLGMNYLEREKLFREKAGIHFESGHIFGEEGHNFERLNLANPRSVIEEVLNRVRKVLLK